MSAMPLLTLAIWVPILAGALVLATGSDRNAALARTIALLGAIAGFVVTLPLAMSFDTTVAGMQFVESTPWITRYHVNYSLGIDGISLLLILLNSFTTILVVLAGWKVIENRVAQYLAAFLVMSGLMNGVFAATDALLFYVFFEATLIPMFIVIGVWGGPNRVYAAVKFFLYTLLGSLLMLVALLYLYRASGGSFSLADWRKLPLGLTPQILVFLAFLVAFAVKVPMWPVHTWLPDAHVLPIAPDASHALSGFMIALSLIAVVYIGLVALVQTDMKKLIAYSSISHMGFVTLGLFLFERLGVEGAVIQMISHGFISGAMFLCVGVMYDRMHSRQIADYGGVVNTMPIFASFLMLFAMANSGLPATSGFVGEFMVIMAATKVNFWIAFTAATTLIFGAAYTLWMYKRVIFGAVANPHVAELKDLEPREWIFLAVLAVAVLWMGVHPAPFNAVLEAPVADLLQHLSKSKLP